MKTVLLGDVVDLNPSLTLKKGTRTKFVSMNKLDPFNKKVTGFEWREYSGGSKFQNGDTLLARITPCLENGKTAFVDFLEYQEVGAGSTEFVVMRAMAAATDPHFVYYLSVSPDFRKYAIQSMIGTSGRQRVQNDSLARYEFEIPDLTDQKQIGEFLNLIDDKIELNRRMNETLEKIGQALFKHYFIDNTEAKTWPKEKIKNFINIKNGYAFKSVDYVDSGIPVVRTTNFTSDSSVKLTDVVYLSEEKAQEYENFYLEPFDFLLVMVGASIGKSVIVPSYILPALQNQNMWNFKSVEEKMNFYNIFMLKKLVKKQMQSGSGSARDFFRKDYFYSLKVDKPDIKTLNQFNQAARPLMTKIDSNITENGYLILLRDSLLPRLISGKLKV